MKAIWHKQNIQNVVQRKGEGFIKRDLGGFNPASYPALKMWYPCKKVAGTNDLVDATGKCPNSAPQGTFDPWAASNDVVTFPTQNTYANSFTAIPTEDPGVTDCYPGSGEATLIHCYIQADAPGTEHAGVITFGGSFQMGNFGGTNNGGSFGVSISTSDKVSGWIREASQTSAPTTWLNTNLNITIPTPANETTVIDGSFHSVQVLVVPNQSGRTDRECWVYCWIDGQWGNSPVPFPNTSGVVAGLNPQGTGYDCNILFHPRQTNPTTPAASFHGQCADIQVWKFTGGVPENIDEIIEALNDSPRTPPAILKGIT